MRGSFARSWRAHPVSRSLSSLFVCMCNFDWTASRSLYVDWLSLPSFRRVEGLEFLHFRAASSCGRAERVRPISLLLLMQSLFSCFGSPWRVRRAFAGVKRLSGRGSCVDRWRFGTARSSLAIVERV